MGSKLYQFTPSELQQLLDESNGYSDVLRKVGMNPKGSNPNTLKKIIEEYNLNTDKMDANRKKLYQQDAILTHQKNTIPLTEIIIKNKYPNYSSNKLLKRLVKEGYKEYKCEICGINEWMGKPISLQLHHKDGNHWNNLINNLCFLCPNCHSQTDNYSGKSSRNKGNKKNETKNINVYNIPISRKELKQKIRTIPFTTIGKEFGVTDNAIRKWCKKYQLSFQKNKIKQYSNSQWEKI